eukprot:m.44772 g.44772  ORF g.44772 m.44772 type:complete len:106 (+) comp33548_c1_seq2:341-658(+)
MAAILPDGKLRRVEETVLIPKMMREEAMKRCGKFVEAFTECCRGRTVTMPLKCRKENRDMQDCLASAFHEPSLYNECKERYLEQRQKFQDDFKKKSEEKKNESET